MESDAHTQPITGALKRIFQSRSLRAAAFAFVLTRLIVFTILPLTAHLTLRELPAAGAKEPYIILVPASAAQSIKGFAFVNDAGWYYNVVQFGYERQAFDAKTFHNWAVFPLHPLVWRYATKITGGDAALTGIALSNVFFLCALVLLYKIAGQFGYGEDVAARAVFYIAAFPTSYFFSFPWTESLYLLLIAGCFYLARRQSWLLAGLVGALASATRSSGIILLPALLILYLQMNGRSVRANILSLLLFPTGLIAFMIYLYRITGNALAFKDVQAAWGRKPGLFIEPFLEYLREPSLVGTPWNFKILNLAAALIAIACGFVLVKRRAWAFAFFALASVWLPLSTSNSMGLTRYVMVIFPMYFVLAELGRRPWMDQTIRAIFIALLGLMSALFAANITLAGV